LPQDSKKKIFPVKLNDFENVAGEAVSTSVRHDLLRITGDHVDVRWKEEDMTFAVSGSYGK